VEVERGRRDLLEAVGAYEKAMTHYGAQRIADVDACIEDVLERSARNRASKTRVGSCRGA
jgi:hypothetical protein